MFYDKYIASSAVLRDYLCSELSHTRSQQSLRYILGALGRAVSFKMVTLRSPENLKDGNLWGNLYMCEAGTKKL